MAVVVLLGLAVMVLTLHSTAGARAQTNGLLCWVHRMLFIPGRWGLEAKELCCTIPSL